MGNGSPTVTSISRACGGEAGWFKSLLRPFASRAERSMIFPPLVFFTRSLTDRLADFMVYKSSRAQLQRMDDVIRYLKTVPVWSEYGESRVSYEEDGAAASIFSFDMPVATPY